MWYLAELDVGEDGFQEESPLELFGTCRLFRIYMYVCIYIYIHKKRLYTYIQKYLHIMWKQGKSLLPFCSITQSKQVHPSFFGVHRYEPIPKYHLRIHHTPEYSLTDTSHGDRNNVHHNHIVVYT